MSIGFPFEVERKKHGSFRVEQDRSLFQLDASSDGVTKSEFAEECDLNVLMERYRKSGTVPVPLNSAIYLDTDNLPDLQQAMHLMIEAEWSFNSLPSEVRKEFDNDPVKFVEYATKGENLEKLREWGLAEPVEPTPEPLEVKVVNPPDPAAC